MRRDRARLALDGDPGDDLEGLGSLFIFTLMSHIAPGGGGTLVAGGSPRIDRIPQKPPQTDNGVARFMEQEEAVDGVNCRIIEVCGEPGDAFICHPSILHAASPNHARVPRFMRVKALIKSSPK